MKEELKNQNINVRTSLSFKSKLEAVATKKNTTLSKYVIEVLEKSLEPKKEVLKEQYISPVIHKEEKPLSGYSLKLILLVFSLIFIGFYAAYKSVKPIKFTDAALRKTKS